MLYPSVNELLEKVDSRYTLVVMVSKRARQLLEGKKPLVESDNLKTVSLAVEEIAADKVTYSRPEDFEQ